MCCMKKNVTWAQMEVDYCKKATEKNISKKFEPNDESQKNESEGQKPIW